MTLRAIWRTKVIVFDDDDAVLARQAHEKVAGLGGLFIGHSSGGFIDEEKFGILREQHADFEPFDRASAPASQLICPPTRWCQESRGCVALRRSEWRKALQTLRLPGSERRIVEDGVVGVNGRRLEFPANSKAVDLISFGRQVGGIAELNLAGVRLCPPVMRSSIVLLPAPFGPMTVRNSPASM